VEIGKSSALIAAVSSPSVGPAILVLFGMQVPVAAMGLSLVGLVLARYIAPKSVRKLTLSQEIALTVLLAIVLIVIVSGELSLCTMKEMFRDGPPTCARRPLGVGMATAWGIGLGTSGLLAIEFFGARFMAGWRAFFGTHQPPTPPE